MEDSVKVTYHHEAKMIQILVKEDKDTRSLWMKMDNFFKLLEQSEELDVSEFTPHDWEKGINPDDFKAVIEEEDKIIKPGSLKCKNNGCNIPVTKVRYFKEGQMEEPIVGDDSICLNEYGFHDHHTGIFWVFRHPRVDNEKRFAEESVPLEELLGKK